MVRKIVFGVLFASLILYLSSDKKSESLVETESVEKANNSTSFPSAQITSGRGLATIQVNSEVEGNDFLSQQLNQTANPSALRDFLEIDKLGPLISEEDSQNLYQAKKQLFDDPMESALAIQKLLQVLPQEQYSDERSRLLTLLSEFSENEKSKDLVEQIFLAELQTSYGPITENDSKSMTPVGALLLYYQSVQTTSKQEEASKLFLQVHRSILDASLLEMITSKNTNDT